MKKQRGAALMVILVILGVVGAYFALKALNSGQARRDMETANTLAHAKDALVGYAVTYRDRINTNEVFGYLPCPDSDNLAATPGQDDPNNGVAFCGAVDVSTVGRLPWSTLKSPPLRDSNGECLWYAVSGQAKASTNKTAVFNWDTLGQFNVLDASGNLLAGSTSPVSVPGWHNRPLAVVLGPHAAISGAQVRPSVPNSECSGNNLLAAYLEGATISTAVGATSTLTLSTADSVRNSTNNDRGLWITNKDVFDRIKRRADFKSDIDNMMIDLVDNYLNTLPVAALPAATGSKGMNQLVTNFLIARPSLPAQKANVLTNWRDNLLYTGPITASVNNAPGCAAVLLFGGERQGTQNRATPTDKLLSANYLEAPNVGLFPGNGNYTGASAFNVSTTNPASPASADIVRCIKGLPAGAQQKSFASDFGSFSAVGSGVTANADKSLTFVDAAGTTGGCFWFADSITLAGKTLRAYYDFKFAQSDIYALPGAGPDRGNGFSLQMLRSDFAAPPTGCGAESNMGVLTAGAPFGFDPNGTNSLFGQRSIIFETDVHRDLGDTDPVENHSAIMLNGTLNHALSGTMSAACNGTASGCRHSPANKFEENPLLNHKQRIEITTGCNAACSFCNPASHVAPNTYAKITTWLDCADCSDVVTDYMETGLSGSELIAALRNRDFSAAGNWTGPNWSITAGTYTFTPVAYPAALPNSALTNPPAVGTAYRVALRVVTTTPGTITVGFGGAAATPIALAAPGTTTHNVVVNALSAGNLTLMPDSDWSGSIDDVSILNIGLGTELIAAAQDRDFSAPGSWTGTNWSLAAGAFAYPANAATLPNLALTTPPLAGTTYRVVVKTATATAGNITIGFGGASTAAIPLTTGATTVHTVQLQASSTGNLTLTPSAGWSGSIDDLSISVSNQGNEQIAAPQNRDFSIPGSWTGINWSQAAGVFAHTPGANPAMLPNFALSNPPVVGSTYRVLVKTMTTAPGTLAIAFGGVTTAPITLTPGTNTHSIQIKATSTGNLTLTPNAAWSGSIDDVSISVRKPPTIERCTLLTPELNSFYFGFTGGFRSGAATQGVTLKNFILRSE